MSAETSGHGQGIEGSEGGVGPTSEGIAIPLDAVKAVEDLRRGGRWDRLAVVVLSVAFVILSVVVAVVLDRVNNRADLATQANRGLVESNRALAEEVAKENEFLALMRQLILAPEGSQEQQEILNRIRELDSGSDVVVVAPGPKGEPGNDGRPGKDAENPATTTTTSSSTTTTLLPCLRVDGGSVCVPEGRIGVSKSSSDLGFVSQEPAVFVGLVQTFVQALVVMVAVFGLLPLSDLPDQAAQQMSAMQGVVTSGIALWGALYVRSRVSSTASLNALQKDIDALTKTRKVSR